MSFHNIKQVNICMFVRINTTNMLSWVNAVRITFIHDISWIWFNWISLSATVYSRRPSAIPKPFTGYNLLHAHPSPPPNKIPIWRHLSWFGAKSSPKLLQFSTNNVKHHTEHSFISLTLCAYIRAIYILREGDGLGGFNAENNRIISSSKHTHTYARALSLTHAFHI